MKSVFITRKIPDIGINMLRDKGFEVDINPNDRPLTKTELISALQTKPYDAVLTLLTDKIDKEVFDAAPTVKIFANYAIGFDNFDVEEGKKRGIFLTNTPGGGADHVAEHTWALIMALNCNIVGGDSFMRQGKYKGWDPMIFHGQNVRGKTLGLIGAGRIGTEVSRIGVQGFGMRVVYHDVVRNVSIESATGATYYPTQEEVLKQADIVSIHVPLLPSTHHLMNKEKLHLMKSAAYLVNTSRGQVIDENALVQALRDKVIAGAGLDVFENEPSLTPGLADLPNVVITPHIASATADSRRDMAVMAAENIIHTMDGSKPKDMVYN